MKSHVYILLFLTPIFACQQEEQIDFSTQIKPIINAKCISCHGGVKKQGGFSFLFEHEALATLDSGKKGIVPGNVRTSEVITRILHEDPELRMPHEEDRLTDQEIELLTTWIKQGAKWGKHWAFQPIESMPEVPEPSMEWGRTPVDAFIAEKIIMHELVPSEPAPPTTLSRRVALDIIGFPSSSEESKNYLTNPTDATYEGYIDALLASPQYGEKWASMWLDLSRYADTKGYEADQYRDIWRYRDWLIKAFNQDKPYDQFITEQLAGDLLENPSDDQYLATAFHRNTMTNDEGGTDNEEFRTAAVIDRVNTTWEALMSTSFACVQCHSHPYDPFTHKNYYEFMAFFNNTRDEDHPFDYPTIRHYTAEQNIVIGELSNWLDGTDISDDEQEEIRTFIKTLSPARNSLTMDELKNAALSGARFIVLRNPSHARLKNVHFNDVDKLIYKYKVAIEGGHCELRLDSPDGPMIADLTFGDQSSKWQYAEIPVKEISGIHDVYFVYHHDRDVKGDENNSHIFLDWLHFTSSFPGQEIADYEKRKGQFWDLITSDTPGTPIMLDNPNDLFRETHMFERGNWLAKTEEVTPAIPATIGQFPTDAPKNRLGLAQWMIDPSHPLTSRTIVNRVWEQLFGRGLVETLEDMGTQGMSPTHAELLDYLSWQFIHEYDWSIKRLLKEIILSDVYRQESRTTAEHNLKDPLNQYYARMSRIRLSAEQIRDQALALSGVLSDKMYGPPVMPYQPEGIWSSPYDGSKWKQSKDEDQYRRAIYTYWKRTSPYPSLMSFDGVRREVCSSRRIRTNTPLQALVTMNDSVYVDLSIKLAESIWDHNSQPEDLITSAYNKMTGKQITANKLAILQNLYAEAKQTYQADKVLTTGIGKQTSQANNNASFAAMVLVSNAILNLDELISKT